MKTRTLEWVASILSRVDGLVAASALGEANQRAWLGAAIDSRADCSGRIFFAVRGEQTDGHNYVAAAHAAGSVAVVVDRADVGATLARDEIPHLVVRDSVEALQELARGYRDLGLDARVVAVTGSAGKTTTKEYIRAVMRSKYRVHSNPGNYNSLIGVPLTVLEAEEDSEYMISEVGANESGEIDFLAGLVRPDVGVITNVGDAHVGHFGSRDAIAAAKGELLDHISAGGTALLPRDDDYFDVLRSRARCKVVTFGTAGADFALDDVAVEGRRVTFTVNGEPFAVPALGSYNAMNACAAYAVGEICGVEPPRMREAFARVAPMPGRGRIHERGGVTIVDESYNASPASMALSLSMLAQVSDASRRIAVLGDMKELGEQSASGHEGVGRYAASLPLDEVWWVGEEAPHVRRGLEGSAAVFRAFADVASAVAAAGKSVSPGDALLVKASRACELDRFVSDLLQLLDEGTGE